MTPRSCPPGPAPAAHGDPADELAALASALAHPARIRILQFLLEQEECFAGAIVEHLPLAQSTVSRHLKVLREAGLVRGEIEGTHVCYCADLAQIRRSHSLLADLLQAGVRSEVPFHE